MNNNTDSITLNNRAIPFLNVLSLVLVLAANTLAVVLPLNGKTTGQLSDQYPNLFVPAGITFSIWGLIYLLLTGFAIYQLRAYRSTGNGVAHTVNTIGVLFIINGLANAMWIFAWHYEKVLLSIFIMMVILISLIVIHERLGIYTRGQGWLKDLFVQIPFSIYLGWISIATIANITALLVLYKWDGWGLPEVLWTRIMIVAGALITLLMILRRNNIYFALVVLWAYYGIIRKRQEVGIAEAPVITTCLMVMSVIIIVGVIKFLRGKKHA